MPALQDHASQVQYWMLMLCDPKAWTPGAKEAAGIGRERGYTKDRNLNLRQVPSNLLAALGERCSTQGKHAGVLAPSAKPPFSLPFFHARGMPDRPLPGWLSVWVPWVAGGKLWKRLWQRW